MISEVPVTTRTGDRARVDGVDARRAAAYEVKNSNWPRVKDATLKSYIRQARNNIGSETNSPRVPNTQIKRSYLVLPKQHNSAQSKERLRWIQSEARQKGVAVKLAGPDKKPSAVKMPPAPKPRPAVTPATSMQPPKPSPASRPAPPPPPAAGGKK